MADFEEKTSAFDRVAPESGDAPMSRAELLDQLKQYRADLIEYKEKMGESVEAAGDAPEKSERQKAIEELKAYREKLMEGRDSYESGDYSESYDTEDFNEGESGEDDAPDSIGQKVLSLHR